MLSFISGLLILFILLPLLRTIILPAQFIGKAIADKEVIQAIFNSVFLSIVSAVIAGIFGIPLAYILARKRFWGKRIVETIVDIPLAIPHTIVGIALLSVFGKNALLGFNFVGTRIAIVTAMVFVSLPCMVNSARDGFEAIDEKLEKVGRTLGASVYEVFRRISLPLAKRNILTGLSLTWARSISEFGAVVVVAYYPMTAPVKIWDLFTTTTLKASAGASALLLIICLTMFGLFRLLLHKK
ncbi:MAG: ABC transporter permease [Candidatus Stahlbacteria bacterium]|nr:ABC transporter permease [Candidatus Stahlbacteria bacterium]